MSHRITCRNCDEEFSPSMGKPGYYDVCARCTERELADNPALEPEPLRAGPSIDEAGTFVEVVPASKLAHLSTLLKFTSTNADDVAIEPRKMKRRK